MWPNALPRHPLWPRWILPAACAVDASRSTKSQSALTGLRSGNPTTPGGAARERPHCPGLCPVIERPRTAARTVGKRVGHHGSLAPDPPSRASWVEGVDEEAITTRLTCDQAFVLSDWLYQVMFQSDDLQGIVHDRAIWSPIYTISGTLDKTLSEIFMPDYGPRLEAAKERLRADLYGGADGPRPRQRTRSGACPGGSPGARHRSGSAADDSGNGRAGRTFPSLTHRGRTRSLPTGLDGVNGRPTWTRSSSSLSTIGSAVAVVWAGSRSLTRCRGISDAAWLRPVSPPCAATTPICHGIRSAVTSESSESGGHPPRGGRSGRTPPGGTPTGGSRAVLADRRRPALAQRRDARRLGLRRGDGRRPLGTDPPAQRSTRGNGPGRSRRAQATPNRFLRRRPSRWKLPGAVECGHRPRVDTDHRRTLTGSTVQGHATPEHTVEHSVFSPRPDPRGLIHRTTVRSAITVSRTIRDQAQTMTSGITGVSGSLKQAARRTKDAFRRNGSGPR